MTEFLTSKIPAFSLTRSLKKGTPPPVQAIMRSTHPLPSPSCRPHPPQVWNVRLVLVVGDDHFEFSNALLTNLRKMSVNVAGICIFRENAKNQQIIADEEFRGK